MHLMTRTFKFFSFDSRGTHFKYFHTNSLRIWSEMVSLAISNVVREEFSSNSVFKTSPSMKHVRLERGLYERSKSPPFWDHLLHFLSQTLPSTYVYTVPKHFSLVAIRTL